MTLVVSCRRNDAAGQKICDAAGKGDLATVEALLKGNPKLVFSKDDKGNTPLHLSASHGYRDVAELLIANKADANASPSLPPSESEYESKPLLERSQLMPGCMTYGLR
jgi:ankyrin repeat protein